MSKPKISSDGRTITVRVPISIKKRGGRKLVITPDGNKLASDGHGHKCYAGTGIKYSAHAPNQAAPERFKSSWEA